MLNRFKLSYLSNTYYTSVCVAKGFKAVDFFIFYRKHAFRDELEAHRRDLEVLRSRVCKYSVVHI